MEPFEFPISAHKAMATEDVYADHVRLTEMWRRETILSVSLPEKFLVPEWNIVYGAIIVFAEVQLPCLLSNS